MARLQQHRLRSVGLAGTVITAGVVLAHHLSADPPAPDNVPVQRPTLLQQLSDQTQQLYRQSRHSMVRVQLPAPQWLEQYNQRQLFLEKWGEKLDPAVREKFLEEQDRGLHSQPSTMPAARSNDIGAIPATRPATQPFKFELQITDGPSAGDPRLTLFAVGLIVDDQGHAVFPMFVDRKQLPPNGMPAVTGDGKITTAAFVGSDEHTNLTVLQLADHTGTPAALGHARPEDGELTIMIAPDGGARLLVWNNQHPESGFAVLPDGAIAGFGFSGHFLGASTAKPIVDQLISFGAVHRAFLGVWMQEVDLDDAVRRQRPELGNSPAIRITRVQENSAAARGGILPNDLILAIGDRAVGDAPTFAAVIATRRGDTTLKIFRGSTLMERTVNLQPK